MSSIISESMALIVSSFSLRVSRNNDSLSLSGASLARMSSICLIVLVAEALWPARIRFLPRQCFRHFVSGQLDVRSARPGVTLVPGSRHHVRGSRKVSSPSCLMVWGIAVLARFQRSLKLQFDSIFRDMTMHTIT